MNTIDHKLTIEQAPDLAIISKPLLPQAVNIEAWFRSQWQDTPPTIYASMDLRNAGFKLAPVDTNLFPAGFNNLNPDSMPFYVQAMQATIAEICPEVTRLLLVPESHSRNLFYLTSVQRLQSILMQAGFEVRIGSLDPELTEPRTVALPDGQTLCIEPTERRGSRLTIGEFSPCCILLNNDLSSGIPDKLQNLTQTIMPAAELGWSSRLKSDHFQHYQEICEAFAAEFKFDPWLIMPYFDKSHEVNFQEQTGYEYLVERATALFKKIEMKYAEYQIKHQPFLVIKADQGTYGMAVMMIDHPEQLLELNRKQRTKMSVSKGGSRVSKVILQEGVHSFETLGDEHSVAEPVIYTIGRHVVGGFYRIHKERGPRENLNAPGMDFQPMPIAPKCHITCNTNGEARFYLYGIIARLALLAAAREQAAVK